MPTEFESFWRIGENYNEWVMEKYHHILRNASDELIQDGSLLTCVEMMRILTQHRPIRTILEDQMNAPKQSSKLNIYANKIILPMFSNPEMKRLRTLRPMYGSGHWACILLDFEAEKIKYFDSLGSPNAYFDFEVLEQKSIEIMVAIDSYRQKKINIPTRIEYLPTTGMNCLLLKSRFIP